MHGIYIYVYIIYIYMKITRFTYSQSWYVAMKSNNNLWWTMWREFSQLFPFFTTFLLLLLLLLLAFLLLFLLLVRLGELLLKSTKLICMYKYAGTISSKHPQWQTAIASKSKLSTFANAHRPLNEHGVSSRIVRVHVWGMSVCARAGVSLWVFRI